MRSVFLLLTLFLISEKIFSQNLKPGFDKEEYLEMLRISADYYPGDSLLKNKIPAPVYYRNSYRSPVMGLDNRWSLWLDKQHKTAVICIRGTTRNLESWLENFYSAMIPATGTISLSREEKFSYQLAENPKAAVHAGWLVGMAFLGKDILPKIDSCAKNGIKDFLITGHSQGGAISYLLTAWIYQLQKNGKLSRELDFKTYCSAAPKPGNLFFAYDYEHMTRNGKAFNVINPPDWVPETPVTIQTSRDFNKTNPFSGARKQLGRQKFPKNLVMKYVYNKLDRPSLRAQKKYEKYLGRYASRYVRKYIPGFSVPEYSGSSNYVRTGAFIILKPDKEYFRKFPEDPKNVFVHHLFKPYYYLAEQYSL